MRSLLNRSDVRVSIIYGAAATLWILLSDTAVNVLFSGNPTLLATVNVLKGWGFVAVTTLVLYAIFHVELRKRDQVESVLRNDIIERTKTVQALRHAESRFATIFHCSPVATAISRAIDGQIIDVNDAFVEMFGYGREDLIGRTSLEVGLWEDPEQRSDVTKVITEAGLIRRMELRGHTKLGKTLQALVSIQSIDLGDEEHFVTMLYDITEQRKLQDQVQYQALLLANVSDAVISTDKHFHIQSWNPAAEAIYGWTAIEVLGKPTADLFKSDFPDSSRDEVIAQLQANGEWRGQTTHQRKDGSRIHLLASTSYVYDNAGRHIGVVSVNRDITDLVAAEQQRQEAEELRIQMQKQSELMRLKESFISVVSHEFRTPLTVIMASAELMLNYFEKMPPERRIKHVTVVLEQARFMTELIDDVLTINKARAGRLDFTPVPLDLVAFCQDTLERIRGVDKDTHLFAFTQQGDLSNVRADIKLLQHTLINLLSNAVKYSPDGGEVRLDVVRQEDEIVFKVSDQGIGIPPEGLTHIFEPFFRANNTGSIGGTGLGMAIVKESVDLHQGTIHFESEVGVGTTVTVRLPAA